MEYKNIFNTEFNFKKSFLLISLLILPNIFAMFHFTLFGIRIHFFQYLIFLAAIIYGPSAGMLSGGLGSLYTAFAMKNPYILVGNMILGGFAGYFMKKRISITYSVLLAFAIQIPWLFYTDVYLAGMPIIVVNSIITAIFVSNILCAYLTKHSAEKIKGIFSNDR